MLSLLTKVANKENLVNHLETTLKEQQEIFKISSPHMSELERCRHELALAQLEKLIADAKLDQMSRGLKDEINRSVAPQKSPIEEFLTWDKEEAIETINFLLQEFFTHSYPGKEWNSTFISNTVFNATRVVNLISKLQTQVP